MNIEEARKKLEITEEERSALDIYLNFRHVEMNSLSDFDVQEYIQARKRGYYLLGFDEDKTPEEVGEEVLSSIDKIAQVYLAMCKYSSNHQSPYRVIRGSSVREAERIKKSKTYDKIISTTTDQTTARSFANVYNPAVLRIKIDEGMPFIDVTDLVGKENLDRYEDEYLFPPFSKIKSMGFTSNFRECSYYDLGIEKPELRPFKDGEKEEFANTIKKDFFRILRLGEERQNLIDEYERLAKVQTTDKEDQKYIRERLSEILDKTNQISKEQEKFSEIIRNYVQGLCSEKEKEFLEAKDIIDQDNIRAKEKQEQEKEEADRKSTTNYVNREIAKLSAQIQSFSSKIDSLYQALKKEESIFQKIADSFGFKFEFPIDHASIETSILHIKNSIKEMEKRIKQIELDKNASKEDATKCAQKVNQYKYKVENIRKLINNLNELIEKYKQECSFATKKGIDEASDSIIKRSRYKALLDKKAEIEGRKISWFGKIRKLNKLKDLELENISLQIEALKAMSSPLKSKYSIHDTLSDIMVFSINELGGQKTPEMTKFEAIVGKFFKVDEQAVNTLATKKLHDYPMVLEPTKKKEKTSRKIARLIDKNTRLRNDISRNGANYWKNSNRSYEARQTVNTQITKMFKSIEQTSYLPDDSNNNRTYYYEKTNEDISLE